MKQDDVKTKIETPGEAVQRDIDEVLDETDEMAQPEEESAKLHGDKLESGSPLAGPTQ